MQNYKLDSNYTFKLPQANTGLLEKLSVMNVSFTIVSYRLLIQKYSCVIQKYIIHLFHCKLRVK